MEQHGSALDILKSERGIYSLLIVTAATFMLGFDKISADMWQQTVLGVTGLYIVGKSATGYAEAQSRGRVAAIQEAAKVGAPITSDGNTPAPAPVTNIINQPSSAPVVDAAGVAVSRTTSRGFIGRELMFAFGFFAAVGVAVALLSVSACGPKHRAMFGKVVDNVVDCTTPGAKDLVKQWSPVLDQVLTRSTTSDGKLDWASVKESAQNFGIDAGGCVLASVVRRTLDGVRNPDAPQNSPLEVDKADLRAGFEQLRRDMFAGKRFKTEAGEL